MVIIRLLLVVAIDCQPQPDLLCQQNLRLNLVVRPRFYQSALSIFKIVISNIRKAHRKKILHIYH